MCLQNPWVRLFPSSNQLFDWIKFNRSQLCATSQKSIIPRNIDFPNCALLTSLNNVYSYSFAQVKNNKLSVVIASYQLKTIASKLKSADGRVCSKHSSKAFAILNSKQFNCAILGPCSQILHIWMPFKCKYIWHVSCKQTHRCVHFLVPNCGHTVISRRSKIVAEWSKF